MILETGDIDFSSVGLKKATKGQALRHGFIYWIGIQHFATAILSAWASTATPDQNSGAPVTTADKVLRRTLAYATTTPPTWGSLSFETSAGPDSDVWLRDA